MVPDPLCPRTLGAEDRQILLGPEAEDPQVIGPVDVIGMDMGEPDRIHMVHPLPDQLEAKLRGNVYEKAPFGQSEDGPVASSPVSRVL